MDPALTLNQNLKLNQSLNQNNQRYAAKLAKNTWRTTTVTKCEPLDSTVLHAAVIRSVPTRAKSIWVRVKLVKQWQVMVLIVLRVIAVQNAVHHARQRWKIFPANLSSKLMDSTARHVTVLPNVLTHARHT